MFSGGIDTVSLPLGSVGPLRRHLVLESPPWVKLCRDKFPPSARLDFLAGKGNRKWQGFSFSSAPRAPQAFNSISIAGITLNNGESPKGNKTRTAWKQLLCLLPIPQEFTLTRTAQDLLYLKVMEAYLWRSAWMQDMEFNPN